MFLTKYNSLQELSELERKIVSGFLSLSFEDILIRFLAVVNTKKSNFAYYVEADLSDVEKEDTKADVKDNILTMQERKHKEEVKKDDSDKLERSSTLAKCIELEEIFEHSSPALIDFVLST